MLSPRLGLCNWGLVQLPFPTLSLQDVGVSRNILALLCHPRMTSVPKAWLNALLSLS